MIGKTISRYCIVEKLGGGGHGDVSLAQECDGHMIVRKGKGEIGNSGQDGRLVNEKEKMQ